MQGAFPWKPQNADQLIVGDIYFGKDDQPRRGGTHDPVFDDTADCRSTYKQERQGVLCNRRYVRAVLETSHLAHVWPIPKRRSIPASELSDPGLVPKGLGDQDAGVAATKSCFVWLRMPWLSLVDLDSKRSSMIAVACKSLKACATSVVCDARVPRMPGSNYRIEQCGAIVSLNHPYFSFRSKRVPYLGNCGVSIYLALITSQMGWRQRSPLRAVKQQL